MCQGWGGNGLRAVCQVACRSWPQLECFFGGELWGSREESYDLSEGKFLSQFLLKAPLTALTVPWMVLGSKTGTDSGQATFSTPLPTQASRAEESALSVVPK